MTDSELLGGLLKNVSRSFYLTLRVLPGGLRETVGLAYLLARAADTIADTAAVPPQDRLDLLLSFRQQVETGAKPAELRTLESRIAENQGNPHEKLLLRNIEPALDLLERLPEFDRAQTRKVVRTLTEGMEMDLRTFPPENSGALNALQTIDDLERYTYLVAGCVGEFWTVTGAAHIPALKSWDIPAMSTTGIRFGKALQYTNILRDCAKDIRMGRCYYPADVLARHGLTPNELLNPGNSDKARPVLKELTARALEHYDEARKYILAIPPNEGKMRLACLWPVLIGLKTMARLSHAPDWLDPEKKVKVNRMEIKRMLLFSLPVAGSDTVCNWWIRKLAADVGT